MSNINILSSPASSYTIKMMPVYNGLYFTVDSNRKNRSNFKFTAEVFVGGTKVATLKQNKDISSNSYGIFDIGRIVENFTTATSPKFQTFGTVGDTKEYQSYQIKFGAEYDRVIKFANIFSSGGFSNLAFSSSEGLNDCRIGDRIFIVNNSVNPNLNGVSTIISANTLSLRINKPFYGAATGTIIEGEGFFDNVFVGGYVGFAIPITRPTRINVGDTINIIQDPGATFKAYDGEWLCTKIFNQVIGGVTYQVITTNCPFLGNTPAQGGMVYSISKYNFTGITTSTLEYAWDAGLQYKDYPNWDPSNYAMNLTNKGKFLTNAPITQKIRLNEDAKLTSFNTSIVNSSTIRKGVFKTYNSSNSLLGTYSHNLNGSALSTAIINSGVGTKNLSNLSGSALNDNVKYYTYEYQNLTGGTVSEVRTFLIDRECFRYTQKRFKWKNRLGGWDFYTFNLRSNMTVEIERSNFRKFQNSFNSSTNKYGYSIGDRGNTTYNVNARDSEIVYSKWLNNSEAIWLEELFTSPEAYIIDGSNELPIILTDTKLVIGEKENRGLISYSINYDYAYNKVIQRG